MMNAMGIVIIGIALATLSGMSMMLFKSALTRKEEREKEQYTLYRFIPEVKRIFGDLMDESLKKLPRLMKDMYDMEMNDDD